MAHPAGDASPVPAAGVIFDLLMAVMNSVRVWEMAAGGTAAGLRWRDAVTARMIASSSYAPYEALVESVAVELSLGEGSTRRLWRSWSAMEAWPDVVAIRELGVPFGFLTNCSTALAEIAVSRSGLRPAFTLSAEEVGWFKPDRRAYLAACTRLNLPPHRTLFIAGAPYDANGALAAGLRSMLVRRRADQPAPAPGVDFVLSLETAVAGAADMPAPMD